VGVQSLLFLFLSFPSKITKAENGRFNREIEFMYWGKKYMDAKTSNAYIAFL